MAKITLQVRPWTGDHETREGEETVTLLLNTLLVDGEPIRYKRATIGWDGRTDDRMGHGFLAITLLGVPPEDIEPFEDRKRHLLGSRPDCIVLPIESLEVA